MPLLINKPKGYTSHDIVSIVRKHLRIKTVGHAGTLDPLASGLLIILVGREETKQQAQYMAGDKEYIAEITLGNTSVTYDAQGPFTPGQDPTHLTLEQIQTALQHFVGTSQQQVPMYSAVKIQGQRLHRLARQGQSLTTALPIRTIIIYEIALLEMKLPVIKIRVRCSKGTYIRSLAHDLGRQLGVGAYLSNLVRTKSGQFSLEQAQTLEELLELPSSIKNCII